MESAKLNDWMQVAGSFALVASLIFVGLQMKQAQGIGNAERLDESVGIRISRNEFIAQHAAVIAKANDGGDLSNADEIVLDRLVDSLWAEAFFGERARQVMGSSVGGGQGNRITFSRYLHENPGIRKVWTISQAQRQQAWAAIIGEAIQISIIFDNEIENDLSAMDRNKD